MAIAVTRLRARERVMSFGCNKKSRLQGLLRFA
jgi:hypothetical protein